MPQLATIDPPFAAVSDRARPRPDDFAVVCRECGRPLRRADRGRPPHACSDDCRRRYQNRLRKLRTRVEALAAWRALAREPDRGGYTRAVVRRHIRELQAEVHVLSNHEVTR